MVSDRKNYKYSKKVYRLSYEKEIPSLFDNGYTQNCSKYFGKISGIPVRINFSLTSSCTLNAKTEEDLETVYKEVIKVLSGG